MLSDCLSSIDLKLYAAFRSRTKVFSCCLIGMSSIDLKLYAVVGWSTKVFSCCLIGYLYHCLCQVGVACCVSSLRDPQVLSLVCVPFSIQMTQLSSDPYAILVLIKCQIVHNWSPLASDAYTIDHPLPVTYVSFSAAPHPSPLSLSLPV